MNDNLQLVDLDAFISQAISCILKGVKAAQRAAPGRVAPFPPGQNTTAVEHGLHRIQPVEFNVSVTAKEETGGGLKLKAVFGLLSGEANAQGSNTTGFAATLKFQIPVSFVEEKPREDTKILTAPSAS